MAAYRPVDETALGLAQRWAPHAGVVFQRLVDLSTSAHLTNPDGLKVWLEGLRASSQAGDVFAARLNDAWDLVSAGHRIAVEETAMGVAELIDLLAGVDVGPRVDRAQLLLDDSVVIVDQAAGRHA
jgi:hypothetical protein